MKCNKTIAIVPVDSCSGCAACAAICLHSCIEMRPNQEGFPYPEIDDARCTGCGRCAEICPGLLDSPSSLNSGLFPEPVVYAAWHKNPEIRSLSSSGGVFSALAEKILMQGGVVVGAAFDANLVVRHTIVESMDDLCKLRGSKYVQSEILPDLYLKIRTILDENRIVLFSGTPCQIGGLRAFLKKQYSNLFCCDIVCHGVPSPMFLERYVRHVRGLLPGGLQGLSFRDKTTGWTDYNMRHDRHKGLKPVLYAKKEDPFMLAFLTSICLRTSCHECRFASASRLGDLSLGDFWGVKRKYPLYDCDDLGTSLVLVNTPKGTVWLDACSASLEMGIADLDIALQGNLSLARPVPEPESRVAFFHDLPLLSFSAVIRKYGLHRRTRLQRIVKRFQSMVGL